MQRLPSRQARQADHGDDAAQRRAGNAALPACARVKMKSEKKYVRQNGLARVDTERIEPRNLVA